MNRAIAQRRQVARIEHIMERIAATRAFVALAANGEFLASA
jgi:hypothetical protein